METRHPRTEFDSAIIRVELLKRSQITTQAKTGEDEGRALEIDGKCVRLDPRHRELQRQPFDERY
jgi:hypothetical protein